MPTSALSPADARSYFGYGRQTTPGTGVVPARFCAYVGPVSVAHNPNIRDIREAGSDQVIARQVKDFYAPGAEFAIPGRPESLADMLAMFLGTSGTPSGAGPYVHTITKSPANVLISLERNVADDTIERIVDAIITQVTLDFRKRDQGPEVMAAASAEGLTVTSIASPTIESYEADRPFLRSDCEWTIDGAAATNVESATLGLQWAIDAAILADNVTRLALVKLHLTATIEVVQLFNTAAERTAYLTTHYGSATAGTAVGEVVHDGEFNVTASYGTGAGERTVEIDFPVVNWGEAMISDLNPDATEAHRLTRRGVMVANPSGAPVTVTATNSRSTAYVS